MSVVYAVLHATLGILIPVPNIVVIIVAYKLIKAKRAKGYVFIINLAVADLLVGLMCVVETLDDLYDGDFDKNLTFCLLRICFTISPCVGSVLTLLLISLDRWLAVTRPLHYHKTVTNRTVSAALAALWGLSFSVGNLPLIAPQLQQTNYTGVCGLLYSTKNQYLYIICFVVFMPVFLTLICAQILLGRTAHLQRQRIRQVSVGPAPPRSADLRHFKALRTVLVVIVCFSVSWGPYYMAGLVQASCARCHLKALLRDELFLLGELNSLLNPLIYAFCSNDIKSRVCQAGWWKKISRARALQLRHNKN
ncbi:glucose-dependent insulinotropic receptor [Lepisosteus oculatus]|uniref:glucose-dependent insulinotropic receptor n=1 Tax=Lepisosteus oculatus TaxID=7918 RepID=UPI0003EA8F18|nr:PREDICTED: glucose-dependent insulinotropic receptor-like [Lepisosteus oculatus]